MREGRGREGGEGREVCVSVYEYVRGCVFGRGGGAQ